MCQLQAQMTVQVWSLNQDMAAWRQPLVTQAPQEVDGVGQVLQYVDQTDEVEGTVRLRIQHSPVLDDSQTLGLRRSPVGLPWLDANAPAAILLLGCC